MSEYWKSLPRKFCDTCKCWFADNKASIDFHEKGKRHQENVQKRISEIQKKGLKEFKARRELENDMKKIEEAALEAFKKDLQDNPELAEKYKVCSKPESCQKETESPEKYQKETKILEEEQKDSNVKEIRIDLNVESSVAQDNQDCTKLWYEGLSEDGYTYYWNSETSESQWEPPADGYVSLQEQNQENASSDNPEVKVHKEAEEDKEKEFDEDKGKETDEDKGKEADKGNADPSDEDEAPFDAIGPQPKGDPYGRWITVEHKPEEFVDLQLPEKPESIVQVNITLPKEETFKIKEKIVGRLNDTFSNLESTFKKRKIVSGAKRNVRKRLEEDN